MMLLINGTRLSLKLPNHISLLYIIYLFDNSVKFQEKNYISHYSLNTFLPIIELK